MCTPENDRLQALIPLDNPGLTALDHPTFFFYIPFGNDVVDRVEFSMLLWTGEMERHYKADLSLPESPGIVRVTLPHDPTYALEEGQYYRWYFSVYCQDGMPEQPDVIMQPDLAVSGTIQRVVSTAGDSQAVDYDYPELWHDVLASAADKIEATPNDPHASDHWNSLLHHIDAGELTQESLRGTAVILSE